VSRLSDVSHGVAKGLKSKLVDVGVTKLAEYV
jgi:hypothetical protein